MPNPSSRAPHSTSGAGRRGDPSIYARLASQTERRARRLTPPRGTRTAGVVLCFAIAATIAMAAARVPAL